MIEERAQLHETRKALQITKKCLEIGPELLNQINSADGFKVWAVFENNYLILRTICFEKDILILVSSEGTPLSSYIIKGKVIQIQMVSSETVLIYQVRNYSFILTTLNLKNDKVTELQLRNPIGTVKGMVFFPESSLIFIYNVDKVDYISWQKYCLQRRDNPKKIQRFRLGISLAYYRYPLQDYENSLVHKFQFEQSFDSGIGIQFFVRMDNHSMVGMRRLHWDQKQNWSIFTYSIETGLVKYNLGMKFNRQDYPNVYDLQKLGSGSIYFRTNHKKKPEFLHYIMNKSKVVQKIPQMSNVHFQFIDCFKDHVTLQKYSYSDATIKATRYFVDAQTLEVWGTFKETEGGWSTATHLYDNNLEVWWKYDKQIGRFLIRQVRVRELKFQRQVIITFLLLGLVQDFDDDLIQTVLCLSIEKW